MPLSPGLARWLVEHRHDAIHAAEAGLDRSADEVILHRALSEQRVVITADMDYPRLLAIAKSKGPGLILFRGGNYSERESLERLQHLLDTIPNEELPRSIVVIEKARIRRRLLPLEPF